MAADFKINSTVAKIMLDAIDTEVGSNASFVVWESKSRGGATPPPTTCASAVPVLASAIASFNLKAITAFKPAIGGGGQSDAIMSFTASTYQDTSTRATTSTGIDFFRVIKSTGGPTTGECVLQGTVDTAAADLIVNTTTVAAGNTFTLDNFKIVLPLG